MASVHSELQELDSLTVHVIVDNELDPISPATTTEIKQSGNIVDIAMRSAPLDSQDRAGAIREFRMDKICHSAHGLSLLIVAEKNGVCQTIMFDTGPEEVVWKSNAQRLGLTGVVGSDLERIVLSHWHRDHSGGMLEVVRTVAQAKLSDGKADSPALVVDLHPARPMYRGAKPPGMAPITFEADPSFTEIEKAGGKVEKNQEAHLVLNNTFLVSGEIPRVTEYEQGLKFGVRLDEGGKEWKEDETITDERFLMCKVKGKGIVMFTGCSHGGVINASKYAVELGAGTPLYAVMGGFHLADAQPAKIQATVEGFQALGVKVLLAGHCTGWRAKFEIQKDLPDCLMPSFVGSKYVF